MIDESVRFLCSAGREVIYDAEHFFDGWKSNRDYAMKTIQTAAAAGARLVVLCDTNGGSMPEEIAALTGEAIAALSVPVGIHCHNDCDLAVANSLAAIDAGAVQVQGTVNGIGERCGNADLISVIANLAVKKKQYEVLAGDGIRRLAELSRFVYETANMNYRPGQPFVGQSAFAHKGGMHVHAVARATESYEHIDPAVVGNERRILVSELSGRSNIVALTAQLTTFRTTATCSTEFSPRWYRSKTSVTSSRRPMHRLICWCGGRPEPFTRTSKRSAITWGWARRTGRANRSDRQAPRRGANSPRGGGRRRPSERARRGHAKGAE